MRWSRATEDADGEVLNAGTDLVLTLFGVMTCLFACVAGKELLSRKQLESIKQATSTSESEVQKEKEKRETLERERALAAMQLAKSQAELAASRQEVEALKEKNQKLVARIENTDEDRVRLDLVDIRGGLNRVAIIVDRSTSMLYHGKYTKEDGVPKERIGESKRDPAKWNDVLRVVEDWIKYLPMRESVLVMFSSSVSIFPKDHSWRVMTPENREASIRDLKAPENFPDGATNTLAALEAAFGYPGLDTIILFTDGRPDVDGKTSEDFMNEIHKFVANRNLARKSRGDQAVTINTVALGEFDVRQKDDPPGDLPMLSFLIKLAEDTKGAFHARRPLEKRTDSTMKLDPEVQPSRFDIVTPGKRMTPPPIYQGRSLTRRLETALKYGGTDISERTVELSLRWLAAHQNPEGYWDADGFDSLCPPGDRCTGHAGLVKIDEEGVDRLNAGKQADAGVTALALLAFLGAGYTHEEGQYADQIDRTLSWLIRQQRADGYLGGKATRFEQMYCHAMATYALAEAYGMLSAHSSDSRLREPVNRAVKYIVENQNADGGWRYEKGQSSDMSIFGWQLMALKSTEIAGLTIPESTKAKMVQFLKERSQGPNKGLAGYRLIGGQPTPPTDAMTAEALFCKQMLGLARTNPASEEAVDYLTHRLPRSSSHNLYYWYYATLAMHQHGGPQWKQWNDAMRETLVAEQRTIGHAIGSWDPKAPWGAYGGRIFSTAMSTLCLEVYYRFLPLHQQRGATDGNQSP